MNRPGLPQAGAIEHLLLALTGTPREVAAAAGRHPRARRRSIAEDEHLAEEVRRLALRPFASCLPPLSLCTLCPYPACLSSAPPPLVCLPPRPLPLHLLEPLRISEKTQVRWLALHLPSTAVRRAAPAMS